MTTAHPPVDPRSIRIESLTDAQALNDFDSGESEVDKNISKCCDWHGRFRRRTYCAFMPDQEWAVGFYCLGISATESKYLDGTILHSDDRYGYVPFVYLNYLAVRSAYQNQKIGTLLLMNALERSWTTIRDIGVFGVALNALNDRSAGLYDRYGFREYGNKQSYPFMILPALSVQDLFG